MGDYLQNIVLRSLSLADVVQPRVPQLFEQTSASEPLPESFSQTEMTPVMRDPIAEVQTQMAARETRRADPEERLTSKTSIGDHQLPFVMRVAEPASVVQEHPAVATLITPATTLDSELRRAASGSQPSSEHKEHKESQAGSFRSEPSVAMIDRNSPALANVLLQSSMPKQTSPSLAQNLRAESQPTSIKISIGRVDVRAIMPSGPPKSSAAVRPKPALSLESYLKQREEGKR